MAQSPSTQQRAQLIREMSRDLNRTRHSTSSRVSNDDGGFTTSDFDPDHDALMSTRQLDNFSQRLPELRASAQKYGRYSRPEPDYAINTSAIARAFPDFTQGPSSLDDDSRSIEIGRGLKNGPNEELARSREFSSNAGNSMDFSPAMIGNYRAMNTPPKRPSQPTKKTGEVNNDPLRRSTQVRRASSLQKQVLPSSPPAAKTTDYGSGGSRQGSAEHRQTLAAIHARVTDGYDDSVISEERPATVNLTSRSTRFGSGRTAKASEAPTLPSNFTSTQGFIRAASQGPADKQHETRGQVNNGTVSSVNAGNQHSIMLPDLPNLSELVSGVFEDGTPVFSRHGNARAPRFVSGSRRKEISAAGETFAKVSGIPVPDDEQAIFVSLRLLQDKVADLEKSRAEAESTIQELQEKNQILERERSESKRFRRSDSALGTTDGSDAGDEGTRGPRKWIIEKTRLESSIRALQEQANIVNRKISVSDITIKNLTQERDSAVAQLGVAYFTTEQLKGENELLSNENRQLKAEVALLKANHSDKTQKMIKLEESLRRKIQRRDETVQELRGITGNIQQARNKLGQTKTPGTAAAQVVEQDENTRRRGQARNVASEKEAHVQDVPRRKKTRMVVEEYSESEDSVNGESTGISKTAKQPTLNGVNTEGHENAEDMTFLSFIDDREIENLRKTLEQERLARKQRGGLFQGLKSAADATKTVDTAAQKAPVVPRKSSMKDLTGRVSNKAHSTAHTQQDFDLTTQSKASATHHRRHSENSLLEQRNQRRGLGMEEMTSAFILPDITMRVPTAGADPTQKTFHAGPELFDLLPKHDGQNCTICKRVVEPGTPHNHDEPAKETIKISKPVPVSERMPEKSPYEEEPTIRPAEPPAIALAKVMKCLEDELAHLKLQQTHYQALYNQHDPSLSKRKRKSVLAKIEKLINAIDAKADQIYALYDVLEGQKADGKEISEQEVEITLQSIGVDLKGLGLRGADGVTVERKKVGKDWDVESSDGSEGELPWEGFETTGGTTERKSWGI